MLSLVLCVAVARAAEPSEHVLGWYGAAGGGLGYRPWWSDEPVYGFFAGEAGVQWRRLALHLSIEVLPPTSGVFVLGLGADYVAPKWRVGVVARALPSLAAGLRVVVPIVDTDGFQFGVEARAWIGFALHPPLAAEVGLRFQLGPGTSPEPGEAAVSTAVEGG